MTFGFAELQGGGTRVRIVPALGGKIVSLESLGREWLWTNGTVEPRTPVDGASYAETGDTGGYDECFPTAAACQLPSGVQSYGGMTLPDHGELWTQRAAVEVETLAEGQRVVCQWTGRRMPYRFSRAVQVTPAGTVVMRYSATNTGQSPLPFVWSAQPVLPLSAATRLDIPNGARVRVAAQYGDALRGLASEFRWPHARLEKRIAELSVPDQLARHYACKLFIDVPPGASIAAVEEGDARLEVAFDERQVPHLALWINKREWTAAPRGKPHLNLAFGPCIGAPDSLTDALGEWRGAQWLTPGETRSWTLTWRTRRLQSKKT
jgi:galactose mutarotase-like enzyme